MSKLPKAPLIEVIFELRWRVEPSEFQEIQYLHGDFYPLIRKKYPFRETIQSIPIEFLVNAPTHRFRTAANDYPLVQLGPGVLTLNTTDPKYFWEEFEVEILSLVEKFMSIYPFTDNHNVKLTLQYIDLIKFDFQSENLVEFLNENLQINISQGFYKGGRISNNLALALNFENKLGLLGVYINRGKSSNGQDGIAIQTNITSFELKPDVQTIKSWLGEAHELCSTSFKEMTKGRLYTEFSQK